MRHNRFFEVGYDETPSYDDFGDVDSAKLERIIDLSDILTCISRLSVEAYLYQKIRDLKPSGSLEEALQSGSLRRKAFEEQMDSAGLEPKSAAFDWADTGRELHQCDAEGLRAYIELSGNDSCTTVDDIVRRLSAEVRAKVGRTNVFWRAVAKGQDGREFELLTFEKPH